MKGAKSYSAGMLDNSRVWEIVLVKMQEALLLYRCGIVSFGRAAEIAGFPMPEMIRQARAFGLEPRWSEKMVDEELA